MSCGTKKLLPGGGPLLRLALRKPHWLSLLGRCRLLTGLWHRLALLLLRLIGWRLLGSRVAWPVLVLRPQLLSGWLWKWLRIRMRILGLRRTVLGTWNRLRLSNTNNLIKKFNYFKPCAGYCCPMIGLRWGAVGTAWYVRCCGNGCCCAASWAKNCSGVCDG